MKVIDLLNKIANGEKVPSDILFRCGNSYVYYRFDYEVKNYVSINDDREFLIGEDITALLNEEVEIPEEDTTEEIEELKNRILDMNELEEYILDYHSKINELVRTVNSILNKKGDVSE